MPRQGKIEKYELEEFVLGERTRGRTAGQIKTAVNDELVFRGIDDSITSKAVERYLLKLDAHSVPEAHQPQVAARNAAVAFDVANRLGLLDGKLAKWIEQADLAVKPVQGVVYDCVGERIISADALGADSSEDAEHMDAPVVQVYEIDWQARKAAASELRQACDSVAGLLERVHNAENVRAFQESVAEAIAECEPAVAARIVAILQTKQTATRAALLGVAA